MGSRLRIENLLNQPTVPVRGILSSTLVPSAVVQAILPAYIRHEDFQDVVFVYTDRIVIKKYVNQVSTPKDGPRIFNDFLEDVTVKDDFDSTILAARILGNTAPHWSNKRPATDDDDDFVCQFNTPPAKRSPIPVSTQLCLKNGQLDANPPVLPPQLLVLTLRSGNRDSIVFMFGLDVGSCTTFLHHHRPMPNLSPEREALRLGPHLAVDIGERAVAVSARENNFMIYRLKKRKEWIAHEMSRQGRGEDFLSPIVEERVLQTSGNILKMEFLQSPSEEPYLVILLLVVSFDGQMTQMQRWDWDSRRSLRDGLSHVWIGMPVEPRLREPHLLIPLSTEPGFIMVADEMHCRFLDIMTGPPKMLMTRFGDRNPSHMRDLAHSHLKPSKDSNRWTAWAKPSRRQEFFTKNDHIYLCHQDGTVQYLEFRKGGVVGLNSELNLSFANDTAFAVLDNPSGDFDILVTEKGLVSMPVRKDPEIKQTFDNWSHLAEFTVRRDPFSKASLLAFCGKPQPHSHLHRLHNALEAVPVLEATFETDASACWLLPLATANQDVVVLVSSTDDRTHLRHVSLTGDGGVQHDNRDAASQCFTAEGRTVLATCMEVSVATQVTTDSIRASNGRGTIVASASKAQILKAAVDEVDPYRSKVMLLLLHDESYWIQCVYVTQQAGRLTVSPVHLDDLRYALRLYYEPSSICMLESKDSREAWVAVSVWPGRILLFRHRNDCGFENTQMVELRDQTPSEDLKFHSWGDNIMLLCGLRNGGLIKFELDKVRGKLICSHQTNIGAGPVKVVSTSDGWLALCDGRLWKGNNSESFGMQHQRVALAANLDGMTEIFDVSCHRTMAGNFEVAALLGASEISLTCMTAPRVIARRQILYEEDCYVSQVRRVLPYNDILIVAYQETHLKETPSARMSGSYTTRLRRLAFPRLGILDPASETGRIAVCKNFVGISGELVHDMVEWKAKIDDDHYRLIVVCTERPKVVKDKRTIVGRVYLYTLSNDGGGLSCKNIWKHESPVYAAKALSSDKLVICCGGRVLIRSLVRDADGPIKWQDSHHFELRAPGNKGWAIELSKTVQGRQLIHVATEDHVETLKWQDGELKRAFISEYHMGLGEMKIGYVDSQPILLTATEDGVIGLTYTDPDDNKADPTPAHLRSNLNILFEVKLESTVKLLRIYDGKFIGGSVKGSFYQFTLLDEKQWQLLRFLQNWASRDQDVCPFTYTTHARAALEPNSNRRPEKHVEGDVIRRALERGFLDRVFRSGMHDQDVRRFAQLAQAVIGCYSDARNLLESVKRWILDVMLEPCV